jgi:hypothetical protein
MVPDRGEDDGDSGEEHDVDSLTGSGEMTPFEKWLDVSTVEQSGVDDVRLDRGGEAIGVGEVGEEGGEDGYAGPEDKESKSMSQLWSASQKRTYVYRA